MAGSFNRVFLIGRLGRDPEMRYTPSGQPVANFSLATDESYAGKDGQKVDVVEWHNVTVWGKPAEFVGNYLSKGRLAYVEGKLETRKWTDKDGAEKYTTEIRAHVVQGLEAKPDNQGQACGEPPLGAQGCSRAGAGANTDAGMDEKKRPERIDWRLEAKINAFNKATKGALPIIKKQVAESMMKDASPKQRDLFMSRVDLS